ncbi:MAG: hypothetical protein ACXWP5_14975 [Bdellovibrionota bacterium]
MLSGITAADAQAAQSSQAKYQVSRRGLCLSIISQILYDTSRLWPQIAKWNQLPDPNRIYFKQVLTLNQPTRYSESEIAARTEAYFAKPRLLAKKSAPQRQIAAVTPGEGPVVVHILAPSIPAIHESIKPTREQAPETTASTVDPEQQVLDQGAILEDQGKHQQAVVLYRNYLENHHVVGKIASSLGELYLSEKNFSMALPIFRSCREKNPENLQCRIREIVAARELKRYPEEKKLALQAMEELPDFKQLSFFDRYRENRAVASGP